MLQLVLDGQVKIRADIRRIEKRLDNKIDGVEERITKRIDRLGSDLAYL